MQASPPASPPSQPKPNLMQLLGNVAPLSPTMAEPGVGGVKMGSTTNPITPLPVGTMKTTSGGVGGGFDDLWKLSLGSVGNEKAATGDGRQGKSMKELQKEKAAAGLWGAGTRPGGDDLLL